MEGSNMANVQIGIEGLTESVQKIVREPTVHKLVAMQEHDITNLETSTIRITFEIETKLETGKGILI